VVGIGQDVVGVEAVDLEGEMDRLEVGIAVQAMAEPEAGVGDF
jgi:hypothetical protein